MLLLQVCLNNSLQKRVDHKLLLNLMIYYTLLKVYYSFRVQPVTIFRATDNTTGQMNVVLLQTTAGFVH